MSVEPSAATQDGYKEPVPVVFNASIASVLIAMPIFFFGAMVVLMREDFAMSDAQIGLVIASYFLVSTLSSVPGGHLADTVGARRGMIIGITFSGLSLVLMGAAASQWWHVAGCLGLAGLGSGIGMPSSNLALARLVAPVYAALRLGSNRRQRLRPEYWPVWPYRFSV